MVRGSNSSVDLIRLLIKTVLLFVLWYLHKRGKESRLIEEDVELRADMLALESAPPPDSTDTAKTNDFLTLTPGEAPPTDENKQKTMKDGTA